MRLKLIFLQSLFLVLASCTKVNEPYVTSFQLVCTDYVTGDTLPDIAFEMRGVYASSYNFNAQTNPYGNFDTVLTHKQETDFEFLPAPDGDYYLAQKSGNVTCGTNTVLDIELLGLSTLKYDFDCSGPGGIQNISHQKLVPIPVSDPLYNNPYGYPGMIYTSNCGFSSVFSIFSGEWIIAYDYRPSVSAPWTQISDTIFVEPGEDFIYSIVY